MLQLPSAWTVALPLNTVAPVPSSITTLTVWPGSTPVVLPLSVTLSSSLSSTWLSPVTGSMSIVGSPPPLSTK